MEMSRKVSLFIFFFSSFLLASSVYGVQLLKNIRSFQATNVEAESGSKSSLNDVAALIRSKRNVQSRLSRDVTDLESQDEDPVCEKQQEKFADIRKRLQNGERLEEKHSFDNESKFNLALAWAGENDDGTLLVLTTDLKELAKAESTLWRSTDHGRTWIDWTSKVDNNIFRKNDGLQRNEHNAKKIYLISYEHFIYVTDDGGKSFYRRDLTDSAEEAKSLVVDEHLIFHPSRAYENYVAVISNDRKLYVTYDNFKTKVTSVKEKVHEVKWGTEESGTAKCIFATVGEFRSHLFDPRPDQKSLIKYDKATNLWYEKLKWVESFDIQEEFMYASVFKTSNPHTPEDERLMMISSDGGETWSEAQLPTIIGDRFFSVLDMSGGLIFMHVDNPGDTGHGTLYTSSSRGLIYSESLKNHLFPNYNNVHDFYKVESIRGVYMASQMNEDKSIHTVISYNRGGTWQMIPRPLHSKCENGESENCYLQVHNAYSIHRGIQAQRPHSLEHAYGIVMVHGHVAKNLQTTPPDVYLSTDGGYNFRKVLEGPHAYEIADSGGLLVAVSLMTLYPKVIKFSTDEGHCWHTYKFTDDTIRFTGLLTEPGGKSMTVSVWGYHKDTKKWTLSVIDFNKVVSDKCEDKNYQEWTPHTALKTKAGMEGCLLGQKETFLKIKPDSWCRNGYNEHREQFVKKCVCTEEDFECDYGFRRAVDSNKCERMKEIPAQKIEVCINKKLEEIESLGYRRIPGDVCEGGFKPQSEIKTLEGICSSEDDLAIKHNTKPEPMYTGSSKLVIAAIVIVILILVAVVSSFFLYKMVILRRHKVVYRYSMLNQNDDEFENRLTDHDTLYKNSSDEEEEHEENNRSPELSSIQATDARHKPHVKSYHDDSDDDMLG